MGDIFTKKDQDRLRELARKWIDSAGSEENMERKSLWKSLKDLEPERPMIHFETCTVDGFINDSELVCTTGHLRNVERLMLLFTRHFDTIEDDMVLEPYFRLAWKISKTGYGIEINRKKAHDSMGYVYESKVNSPDDLKKLKPRTFINDRNPVLALKGILEDIFGDILPVRSGNVEILTEEEIGFNPLVGINTIGISFDVLQILGQEKMLLWAYDYPDTLQKLIQYLKEDRERYYSWMEDEDLLDYNADGWNSSASSYGYCSQLPASGKESAKTGDCWVWAESQETMAVSPEMFAHFYLPAIADVAKRFGLAYYGCCEPVQDRFHLIKKAIPNIRAVSISYWNDMEKAADAVGKDCVFSRKPNPAFVSGPQPQWEAIKGDIRKTYKAVRDLPLEFIIRDVYDIGHDISRINRMVRVIKDTCGI